jgi:predicted ATPase
MDQFVVISGCSGGGKSTLLAELSKRGFDVVDEPGRRIVAQELRGAGRALPWVDLAAFARKAIELARADRVEAARRGAKWVFFDRGLIDACAALAHATGDEKSIHQLLRNDRYNKTVFLAPPWDEIYCHDNERRHDLQAAKAEYDRLAARYPALGYSVVVLPKISVEQRADFLLDKLGKN